MTEAEREKAMKMFVFTMNELLENLRNRAIGQFQHNLKINVPAGMPIKEAPQQAITSAIVHTMSVRTDYCARSACGLAALIVEDCNLHDLAKELRERGRQL